MPRLKDSNAYRYRHTVRLSLVDTQRMERWCANKRRDVDDFIRESVYLRLEQEEAGISEEDMDGEMKLERAAKTKERKKANLQMLSSIVDTTSRDDIIKMAADVDISIDELDEYMEFLQNHKTTLQENCEWLVKGILSVSGEMDCSELSGICVSAGFSEGTAKRAIDSVTKFRKEYRKSIRSL